MRYLLLIALGLATATTGKEIPVDENFSRHLQMRHDFEPLAVNNDIKSKTCTPWTTSGLPTTSSEKVVIEAGTCVKMDVPLLELDGGLDIQGRLEIPDGIAVNINTIWVVVQGMLSISSTKKVNGETDVKFTMKGTDDLHFIPHSDNAMACPDGSCPFGKKAFVVAGGIMDVRALPEDCPTWVKLKDLESEPLAQPASVASVVQPLDGCPPHIFQEDFSNGTARWTGHNGGEASAMDDDPDYGSYLLISNRNRDWQGPFLDLSHDQRACILPDQKYLFSARIKIISNTTGPTQCNIDGTQCLAVRSIVRRERPENPAADGDYWNTIYYAKPFSIPEYNTWTTISSTFSYDPMLLEMEPNVFQYIYFDDIEPGVDIAITDISFTLPSTQQHFKSTDTCRELVVNGDAEANLNPHPFYETSGTWHNRIIVKEEEGNQYFSLLGRHSGWATFGIDLLPGCILKNAKYHFSAKFRIHSQTQQRSYVEIRHEDQVGSFYTFVVWCPEKSLEDGWFTCASDVIIPERAAGAHWTRIQWITPDEATEIIDFDDVSLTFVRGPVTGLKVEESVESCWDAGAEIMVTSHTLNWQEQQTFNITQLNNTGDGSVTLYLNDSIIPPTTEKEDADRAVEVALLSRNVMLTAEVDSDQINNQHGCHFMVFHTPHVAQIIEGIEIVRCGQQDKLGRYSMHFHMCDSVQGSIVSKLSIRDSNQRCVVIHDSHNVTIQDNVAYNTFGHCYMTEDGGENDNFFLRNLGAKTKAVPSHKRVGSDESDNSPATFWITNPKNSYEGNVAAGAEFTGYWIELRTSVRGPSAMHNVGVNPRILDLHLFKDNVAHSNNNAGLRTYPHGFEPRESIAQFLNFKSFLNRHHGAFFHNSQNLEVRGGLFADSRTQIDIDRADNVVVEDALIQGFTPLYKSVIATQGEWYHCPSEHPMAGIDIHSFLRRAQNWGAKLSNNRFQYFEETECDNSAAIGLNTEVRVPHFNFETETQAMTADTNTPLVHFCRMAEMNVTDVYITDMDSSCSPDPAVTGVSTIVSDNEHMTTFADCVPMDNGLCAAYCPNTCIRPVYFATHYYGTENLILQITSGGKTLSITGKVDRNLNVDSIAYRTFRVYAATLPAGSYSASFIDEQGNEAWPTFVEEMYQTAPNCTGHLEEGTVLLDVPTVDPTECEQLIQNGDVETGDISHWAFKDHSISVVSGGASNSLHALSTTGSIGQSVDSRCMTLMRGRQYEIQASFKLVDDAGAQLACDPKVDCPYFEVIYRYFDETIGEVRELRHHLGPNVVLPYVGTTWDQLQGVITITDEMASMAHVFFTIGGGATNKNLLVDNVSVTLLPLEASDCTDLIRNGDFATDTKFWAKPFDKPRLELVEGASGQGDFAIKASERDRTYWSPMTILNNDCLVEGNRYKITSKYKLTDANGDVACIPYPDTEQTRCPEMRVRLEKTAPNNIWHYDTVGLPDSPTFGDGRWSTMSGVFTASSDMVNADYFKLWWEDNHVQYDITVDDVSVVPLPQNCSELFLNGGFESGTASFWVREGNSVLDVVSPGATGQYALKNSMRQWDHYGFKQIIDHSCLTIGSTMQVTAKMKLLNATGFPVECIHGDEGSNLCPHVYMRGYSHVDTVNHHDKDITSKIHNVLTAPWNTTDYHDFEGALNITEDFSVYKYVWVGVVGYNREWDILVDDFSISVN